MDAKNILLYTVLPLLAFDVRGHCKYFQILLWEDMNEGMWNNGRKEKSLCRKDTTEYTHNAYKAKDRQENGQWLSNICQ